MIHGMDGPPGSGKTSAAVNLLWKYWRSGYPVYANIPLYDLRKTEKGEPLYPATFGWPWAPYIADVDDLLNVRKGDILLDEVDMWFSALDWQKVGFEAKRLWTQHRKMGLNILWTCTHIDRVLNVIRDITALQFRCFELPPWFRGRSLQKAFNPQETSTTRKSTMWRMLKYHRLLFQVYHSNFIVGNGKSAKDEKYKAAEMGAAELGEDIEVRTGSLDEILHLAAVGTLYMVAGPGEQQQVSPLLRPGTMRELMVWIARIEREKLRATNTDRATAARLRPILGMVDPAASVKVAYTGRSRIIQTAPPVGFLDRIADRAIAREITPEIIFSAGGPAMAVPV